MTSERWHDVERLFHAALELQPPERQAFVETSCGGDRELERELQTLLDSSELTGDFLESPALDAGLAGTHRPVNLVGRRLSEYEVRARIGAGGMGEVYRARDLNLGRDVAIKVLPTMWAHDRDRVARFRREAQILATLNHPHIAAIYSLDEGEDILALVLELVEGPTLADRLADGALPVEETLALARQIAEALGAAHEKGVVHRDLKPANIKVTAGGKVKVLDFGLAKAAEGVLPEVSTLPTVEATREGVILGTATYMSPEQARGLAVDQRTDIWAFGCVVYEMLTGRRAFRGATVADCIAAIIGSDPDWAALPASTPAGLVTLLQDCLTKDAGQRSADITEVLGELDAMLAGDSQAGLRAVVREAVGRMRTRWVLAGAGVGVVTLVAGGLAAWQRTLQSVTTEIGLANGEFIPPTHSSELAFSPDGTLIAYASSKSMADMPDMSAAQGAGQASGLLADMAGSMPAMTMSEQIYVRSPGQAEARPIGGALGSSPFFSPDGRWLGFWHAPSGTLRKVALTGGAPVKVGDAISGIAGAAWGPGDTIVFAWFDLFRVPAAGGSPEVLLKVDEARGERFYRHPAFLPSGNALLFTIGTADNYSYDDAQIGVLSLETGAKKILIEGGSSPRYSPSGHLIYARGGQLLAVPFDPDALQVTGQPFPVADGVFMSANTGMAAYSISDNGHLVYAAGPLERGARVPVWVDRQGRSTPLGLPPRSYLHPRLSPDGTQLAIEVEGASHDIFTYDLARGVLTKMSFDGASHWPSWTPTGERLTFRSWKTGTMTMWWMPADRSGPAELLTDVGSMQSPESWSPDGGALAFTQMDDPESGSDIYVLPRTGERTPRPVVKTKFSEGSPKFSPDGNWLAYSSNESGRPQVYVIAFPGPGPKIQISTDGGTDPLWRRDGRELYYRDNLRMMAVSVTTGRTLTASKPELLWEGRYLAGVGSSCGMAGPTSANYDVTADGQRFLMIEDPSDNLECRLVRVVSNWSRALARSPAAQAQAAGRRPEGLFIRPRESRQAGVPQSAARGDQVTRGGAAGARLAYRLPSRVLVP